MGRVYGRWSVQVYSNIVAVDKEIYSRWSRRSLVTVTNLHIKVMLKLTTTPPGDFRIYTLTNTHTQARI